MKYTELKKELSEKVQKLHDKTGVFWAFSNDQFKEGAKDAESVTKIGMGGFVPSVNYQELATQTKRLYQWFNEEVKKLEPEKVILYELANHEAWYTGDITDAYEVLKDYGYTPEQVQKVLNDNAHRYE